MGVRLFLHVPFVHARPQLQRLSLADRSRFSRALRKWGLKVKYEDRCCRGCSRHNYVSWQVWIPAAIRSSSMHGGRWRDQPLVIIGLLHGRGADAWKVFLER
jgi:hypothetical protein